MANAASPPAVLRRSTSRNAHGVELTDQQSASFGRWWGSVGLGVATGKLTRPSPGHETITASSPIIPMVLAATCTTIATYMLRTRHVT